MDDIESLVSCVAAIGRGCRSLSEGLGSYLQHLSLLHSLPARQPGFHQGSCHWCRMESAVLKLLQLERDLAGKKSEVKAAREADGRAAKLAIKAWARYENPERS